MCSTSKLIKATCFLKSIKVVAEANITSYFRQTWERLLNFGNNQVDKLLSSTSF